MRKVTKVTYWNRWSDESGHTNYYSFKFKRMWPWVFIRLLLIRFGYDEVEMEEGKVETK